MDVVILVWNKIQGKEIRIWNNHSFRKEDNMNICLFIKDLKGKTMDDELIYISNDDKQNYPSVN